MNVNHNDLRSAVIERMKYILDLIILRIVLLPVLSQASFQDKRSSIQGISFTSYPFHLVEVFTTRISCMCTFRMKNTILVHRNEYRYKEMIHVCQFVNMHCMQVKSQLDNEWDLSSSLAGPLYLSLMQVLQNMNYLYYKMCLQYENKVE